jgi:hypothetical protein
VRALTLRKRSSRRLAIIAAVASCVAACGVGEATAFGVATTPVARGTHSGSISGRLVHDESGQPFADEEVRAFVSLGAHEFTTFASTTDADGRFTIDGLDGSSYGYYVCTTDLVNQDYPVPDGNPSECFPHAYWNPARGITGMPSGAEPVFLTDGEQADVGTMTIAPGSTITGHMQSAFGNDLLGVDIVVRSLSDPSLSFDEFGIWGLRNEKGGQYAFPMLPPSKAGWQVCFGNSNGRAAGRPFDPYGYLNSCYRNVTWRTKGWPATSTLPRHSTPVMVEPGATATQIDDTAKIGGRLKGLVTNRKGKGLTASIDVYDGRGTLVAEGAADQGAYLITGIPHAETVKVCATPDGSYAPRCATKTVTVRRHHTAAGPHIVLHRTVSGT